MKLPIKKVVETEARYIRFHAKMRDEGTYILLDENKKELAEHNGYVPKFFPDGPNNNDSHFGDYVDLVVDIETGVIINWKKLTPEDIMCAFFSETK